MATQVEAPNSKSHDFTQSDGWLTQTEFLSRTIYWGIHLSTLGRTGLRELALQNLAKASYAKQQLEAIAGVEAAFDGPVFNEFGELVGVASGHLPPVFAVDVDPWEAHRLDLLADGHVDLAGDVDETTVAGGDLGVQLGHLLVGEGTRQRMVGVSEEGKSRAVHE